MKTRTDAQTFRRNAAADGYIPHEIAGLCVESGMSLLAAWRTHKGLGQSELAERMGITQSVVAKMERQGAKPQRRALEKAAAALVPVVEQLAE